MNLADDAKRARNTVFVTELTDGILDPAKPMLGPLIDGGTIVGNTAPGCWGPMITPRIRGGHEVTRPVFVAGAEPGDAVVIRIRDVNVTSFATASGCSAPHCFAELASKCFVGKLVLSHAVSWVWESFGQIRAGSCGTSD